MERHGEHCSILPKSIDGHYAGHPKEGGILNLFAEIAESGLDQVQVLLLVLVGQWLACHDLGGKIEKLASVKIWA